MSILDMTIIKMAAGLVLLIAIIFDVMSKKEKK